MKTFFTNIRTHKNFFIVLFLITTLFLVFAQFALAQGGGQGPSTGPAAQLNTGTTPELPADSGDRGPFGFVYDMIYGMAVALGSLFVFIGGFILDKSIDELVVKMGSWFTGEGGTTGLGATVQMLWLVIRDVFNIFFIFSLIYIGIKTILNSEDSGTRRMLGHLILAALLINFSLYITQAIVDFSNIAAVEVYDQIIGVAVDEGGPAASAQNELALGEGSITAAFMDVMGLTSIYGDNDLIEQITDFGDVIVFSVMMMFFLIFAGLVFGWGGILLLTRFVALTLYMVFSPVMFLGLILPKFKSYADKWWSGFLKQCFFAPAYLFMLYLTLVATTSLRGGLAGNSSFSDVFNGGEIRAGFFGIALFFAIMMGFLIGSIKVAQMMGTVGANSAMNGIKSVAGGMSSFAYRNTAGRGLNSVAESKVGNFLGAGGRRAVLKMRDYSAGGTGFEEKRKMNKEETTRLATRKDTAAARKAVRAGTGAGATAEQLIEMEEKLGHMGVADLAQMAQSKDGLSSLASVAGNLSESTYNKLMESSELTPKQRGALAKGRSDSTKESITQSGGNNGFTGGLKKASADQLNAIEFNQLLDNALYVQDGQIDKLESKWGPTKIQMLKQKREEAFENATDAELINSRKDDKGIAQLPKEKINTEPFITELANQGKLNADVLGHIGSESKVDKKSFGQKVFAHYNTNDIAALPADIRGFFKAGQGSKFLPDGTVDTSNQNQRGRRNQ